MRALLLVLACIKISATSMQPLGVIVAHCGWLAPCEALRHCVTSVLALIALQSLGTPMMTICLDSQRSTGRL
eukprot:4181956-Amphidinium_carterae.1